MASIKLSPKHGVNPTIPVCFWCGKEKNELALLGRLPGDAEAPRNCVLDLEPCNECKAEMSRGFTIMEVTQSPNARCKSPVGNGLYPTGQFVVLKQSAAERIFPDADLSKGKAFMNVTSFDTLFGQALQES